MVRAAPLACVGPRRAIPQLDVQPTVDRALKASRLKFWTETLPRKIQELKGAGEKHTEL